MEQKRTIVVMGATGSQGGSAVKYLLNSGDTSFKVRGLTRNPNSEQSKQLLEEYDTFVKDGSFELLQCDITNTTQLVDSLKGAYGLFAVTNFYDKETQDMEGKEFAVGKNIVNAVIQCSDHIKHFIYSALDDYSRVGNGQYDCEIFTSKNRVMQYAKDMFVEKHLLNTINLSFVFMGCYLQNFKWKQFLPFSNFNTKTNSIKLHHILREDTPIPWIDISESGSIVLHHFKNPQTYTKGRISRVSSEYGTLGELLQLVKECKHINIEHLVLESKEEALKWFDIDYYNMFTVFNNYGYYLGESNAEARLLNPKLSGMREFIEKNNLIDEWLRDMTHQESIAH